MNGRRRIQHAADRSVRSFFAALGPTAVQPDTWVFGAAVGKSYSDNSRALFEYVRSELSTIQPRWVISSSSPDWEYVNPVARVDAHSIRAHRHARRAGVLVYSHGVHDIPGMEKNRSALKVRLGHGLTALKRKHFQSSADEKRFSARLNDVGLVTVASPMDREFTIQWGVDADRIAITGLPRWDRLLTLRKDAPRHRLLFAPTWRSWTDPKSSIRGLTRLLCSEGLRDFSRELSLTPTLYCHQNMRTEFDFLALTQAGVEVVYSDRMAEQFLAEAAVVVSDYSSVCWDALYADIPVVFFMFDREDFEINAGSYVDLESLFGWQVETEIDLMTVLEEAIVRSKTSQPQPGEAEWKSRAFSNVDVRNSERVTAEIHRRLR